MCIGLCRKEFLIYFSFFTQSSSLTKYLQSTSENEKNAIFDVMCIKCLQAELKKQPMGSYFDVSYMYNCFQIDDEMVLKCRKNDELLMENVAVQDLMAARGIKLLPLSLQIKMLTTCTNRLVCHYCL